MERRWTYTDLSDGRVGYIYMPYVFTIGSATMFDEARDWMEEQFGEPLQRMEWVAREEKWLSREICIADSDMAFAFRMRWC